MTDEISKLELTGERTLPGVPRENYWFVRHLVAYQVASELSLGKRAIDIGCGEGYGPSILAGTAAEVLGVDIAPEVIEHARVSYSARNLTFEVMDVNHLEVPDDYFDVAVSLQVVEHLVDVSGYFKEMSRILKPGGAALLTTPNRLTISPGSDKPINPFHLREYMPVEFEKVLSDHFDRVDISGLFHAGWLKLNENIPLVDFVKFYEMGRLNPRRLTHRLLTPLITTKNLRVRKSNLERCLDIFAVCRKENTRGTQA